MTDILMTRCETKRLYKVNGTKAWRWVEVAVADITSEDTGEIRCAHCHGAIKVHPGKTAVGVEPHVKHKARVDTDNCQNGRGAQAGVGLSSKPVE
jgi:hypothetical protein